MTAQPYQLVMRSGPTPGKAYPLSKAEIYIGRDVSNDIAINDAEISRKHARLTQQGDSFVVEDLGSTNGTFVDAQRLMGPHVLRPGELIMFGENVGMVFEAVAYDPNATMLAGAPASQPTPPPTTPPPYGAPSTPAQYAGQIPASPAEAFARPKKKGGCLRWVLAGCGCLIILLCLVVVAMGIWYAVNANGFENSVTKVICSGTLKPATNEVLRVLGNYACPAP